MMEEFLRALFQRYKQEMATRPVRTKMLISGCTVMVGECLGDLIRHKRGKELPKEPLLQRCGFYGLYGVFVIGPLFHWWYNYMQEFTASLSSNMRGIVTLLLDRLIFTPPFLVCTIFYRQLLHNTSLSEKCREVMRVIMPALWVNWKVWTVLVAFNVTYIPLEFRSIFGNVFAMAWNTYLSLVA